MRYRILGPLEVLGQEGRPLALGGARQQIVLGALLLEANHVVSRDRLVEAVWSDTPPATAANTLHVYVSKIRKLLGADNDFTVPLVTQSSGYVLRTAPGELDAEDFERLAITADSDEGPDVVVARLTEALSLWRGRVLDGLDLESLGRAQMTRLEELRISVLERRIDAELALGRHLELTGELEALVQTHPMREAFRGQLMVALYRSGRQADALAAYRHARELLAEELGIDPGPTLQALELAVLHHAPELDPPGPEAARRPAETLPPDSAAPIPLPPRLAIRSTVGMVGRRDELRTIADAYKRVAAQGSRELVLIAGEAGLGKTTLAAEVSRQFFDDGACVLFGHCEEDLTRPYQFFAEALGHFVTHASRHQLLAHVGAHGSELSRLLPDLSEKLPDLPTSKATDTDTERYLLFASVANMIADVSRQQPVVLVFDDLQWADRGSLQLLRHLVAAEQVRNVLVVATYRDSELRFADALRDTLGALRRHVPVERIELAGLNDSEVVEFLEAASGQRLDDDGISLAHSVYQETDGNPFFVGEVLRHLAETGAIYQDTSGRWTTGASVDRAPLPDSVREVVGGRVVRLGATAGRVLALAAVIGRDFDLELLALAAATPEDEVLDVLERATAAALVRELGSPGHFQFTHALIQHTLYEDIGPTRLARGHRQVAEALETLCGPHPERRVGELARHWMAAIRPVEVTKAIDYARQAGDSALAALAPADALRYYVQAFELASQHSDIDPVLKLDVEIGLGIAMRQTGDAAFRETLLRAAVQAAELGDTDRLVAAALANSRGTLSTVSAVDQEKVAVLETALERLADNDVHRALVLATLCTELTVGSPLERRQQLADEALTIAERGGDDAIIVQVLNHVLLPLSIPHQLKVLTDHSANALSRAQSVGDPILLCTAASGRRLIAAAAGDIGEMDRCFEIKQPIVERLDLPFLNWVHTLQLATRALIAGECDQSEQLAARALQIGTEGGQPDAAIVFGTQVIMVHLVRGTMATVVPLIELAIADNPGLPVFTAVLALAHAESDVYEEAGRILQNFATADFQFPLDITWLTTMIACADAACACGDVRFAEPLLEQLLPFSDQWLYTDLAVSGPVGRTVGELLSILGRYEEAEAHLAHSSASARKAHALYFSARADLAWGRMLVQRDGSGDRSKARDLLSGAREVAISKGYARVERRATAALELISASPDSS